MSTVRTANTAARTHISRRGDHPPLRMEWRRRVELATGRSPHPATIDNGDAFFSYLFTVAAKHGDVVTRSVHQMVKGMGWQSTGSPKADHQRYRNTITRLLDLAVRVGWVESWRPVYQDNGVGRGMLIVLPAGVAQSVEATPRARRKQRRVRASPAPCSLHSGRLCHPPCGAVVNSKSGGSSTASHGERRSRARARGVTRTDLEVPLASGGAVSVPAAQGTEREGAHRSALDRTAFSAIVQRWQRGAVALDTATALLVVALVALLGGWLA